MILSYTIIHEASSRFKDQVPYAVGIIQLDDGPRITVQVVDCTDGGLVKGQKVKLEFRRIYADGEAGTINYGYKAVPLSCVDRAAKP